MIPYLNLKIYLKWNINFSNEIIERTETILHLKTFSPDHAGRFYFIFF